MKDCVYPLVVYADQKENNYFAIFPDLDISTSGSTIEETYISAVDMLKMYLDFAGKMDADVSKASTYVETLGLNPKRIVLLAAAKIADSYVLTPYEKDYKTMISKLLVNKED